MLNIGAGEIGLILILALLILGPKRLPEMARGIGKFLREFRRQTDEVRTVVEREFYRMDQQIDLNNNASPNGPPKLPGVIAAEAAAAARAHRAAGVPSPALAGPTPPPGTAAAAPGATTAATPPPVAATDPAALAPAPGTPPEAAVESVAAPSAPAVPVESTRSRPVVAAPVWDGEPHGLDDELVGTNSDSKAKAG